MKTVVGGKGGRVAQSVVGKQSMASHPIRRGDAITYKSLVHKVESVLREGRSVKVLIEIGFTGVSNAVQPPIDSFQESVFSELTTALTSVLPRWTAEVFDSLRRQVPIFADQLQDPIIRRSHPFRVLTHTICLCKGRTHMNTDNLQLETLSNECIDDRIPEINIRQQSF